MGKVFLEGHQLAQFQQELDDVRAQVMQNLGEAAEEAEVSHQR